MAESEEQDLLNTNNEMAKAIQHWKMTAAQKENEKLELMKEVNDMRLQLSRLRNTESTQSRKLNAEMQSASEDALSHLVQASSSIAHMLEIVKSYMQGRQQIESALPRWSTLSNTPTNEKVHRVPPLLIGGRHIQPVVSLSRTLQPNNSGAMTNRSPTENNRIVPPRAVPMHMLQDLFIPLTRIDANIRQSINNVDINADENMDTNSTDDLASDDSDEGLEGSPMNQDSLEILQRLECVPEEEADSELEPQERVLLENPLEGPSWLLDVPAQHNTRRKRKKPTKLEPDSTTELHEDMPSPGPEQNHLQVERQSATVSGACEFTPTVRRRRRGSPPHAPAPSPRAPSPRAALTPRFSPRPKRRNSNSGRILKVMVAKMRLSDEEDGDGDVTPPKRPNLTEKSPNHASILTKPNFGETQPKPQKIFQRRSPEVPKRRESSSTKQYSTDGSPCQVSDLTPTQKLMRFDAPSPNGSTDACVIVLESRHDVSKTCCPGVMKSRTLNRINSRENQPNHSDNNPTTSNHAAQSNHSNHSKRQADNRETQYFNSNSNHDNEPTNNCNNHTSQHNHNHSKRRGENNHVNEPTNSRDNHTSQSNHSNHNKRRVDNLETQNGNRNHNEPNNHDNHASQSNHSNHDKRRVDNIETQNGNSNHNEPNNHDNHISQTNHSDNHDHTNHDNRSSRSNRRRLNGHNDNESDSSSSDAISEGRTRRPRKAIIYKEKPLNRKMRR